MLKVLEGLLGMRLNRVWLFAVILTIACGLNIAPASAATSKDKEKQTKTTKVVVKSAKKPKTVRVTVTRANAPEVAAPPSFATALGLRGQHDDLSLKSSVAMVVNQDTKEVYFEKNPKVSLPIASITKLMTAMVVLDSRLPLDETIVINAEDAHIYRRSRVAEGTAMSREEALHLALMSSENRAAYTLGRNYPGGVPAFVDAMNRKARELGMDHSHFADPTGLLSENVATAEDLTRMVNAAYQYSQIRQVSTTASQEFPVSRARHPVNFSNTNMLVRNSSERWDIGLSKTGYISEAGRCLVMQAKISGKDVVLVFLNSVGKLSRIGDAERIRKWLEKNQPSS